MALNVAIPFVLALAAALLIVITFPPPVAFATVREGPVWLFMLVMAEPPVESIVIVLPAGVTVMPVPPTNVKPLINH